MIVKYKKLRKDAIEPTRGSEYAAGLDLYAAEDTYVDKGGVVSVGTGIAIEIPPGYFGAIYARSGLATKQGLRPANCTGIVDSDYRGEIIVPLFNDSVVFREIHKGDRIAQLVIQPYANVYMIDADVLSSTARGSGGFGSTGYNLKDNANQKYDYEQITLYDIMYKETYE